MKKAIAVVNRKTASEIWLTGSSEMFGARHAEADFENGDLTGPTKEKLAAAIGVEVTDTFWEAYKNSYTAEWQSLKAYYHWKFEKK